VGTGILTDLERVPAFTSELTAIAGRRSDVELVDHDRLYHGS
jgi:hypothetical protein